MRVIYFDLDCCRADHLIQYGYHRSTSPSLDRIVKDGVVFKHCYTSNSPCLPSRAALFSGRFGINNGIVSHHGIGEQFRNIWYSHNRDATKPLLQHHLWTQGIKTVSFSCFHDRHNAWWFCAGWQELHTFTRKRGQETADEVNTACIPWIKQYAKENNWFLHIHYWDIHSHYRLTEEWAKKFANTPPPSWPDQKAIDEHQKIYGPRGALDLYTGYKDEDHSPKSFMPEAIKTTEDFKKLIDGYDAAISYVDYHIGKVLDELKKAGVLDDVAFIVSGDHGDSFGEHGQYMDHGIANEAVHNIPMIVRWPGITKKGNSDALIYNLDLAPTLCQLFGFPVPSGWDGKSFLPALDGKPFDGWPYLVMDHGIYTFTRAVRTPDWLLIQVLHPGLYPYEPVFLHNMKDDPHQEKNLVKEKPEIVSELFGYLSKWKQEQVQKGGSPDPLELMVKEGPFIYYTPEKMIARLERTGRKNFALGLKSRMQKFHPGRIK